MKNEYITITENLKVISVVTSNMTQCMPLEGQSLRYWGTVSFPFDFTHSNLQNRKEHANLFGSWKEFGDEDEALQKIYESRLTPSTFKNE